jgi:STE24 endopeptidase
MLSRQILRAYSVALVTTTLLLASAHSQSQSHDAALKTSHKPAYSSLMLVVERNGFARVTVWLPARLDDPIKFRQAIRQSVSFPIKFDDSSAESSKQISDDDELESLEEVTGSREWTFINGSSDQSLSNQGMKSTTQLTLKPLEEELRSAGINRLSIGIMFEDQNVEVALTGGTRLPTATAGRPLNYFQTEVDLNKPTTAVIRFSYGYTPADVARRLIPLATFFALAALLTLWVRRSALRMQEQPAEMWGRYFQFWQLMMSLIWLVWIPICAWTGLSEVISFGVGRDRKLAVQILNFTLYILPPLVVLCISQLLSKPIYDRMRGLEWSPRDFIKKAIATNAVSLLPLFIVVMLIDMLNAGSRFTGLVLIGAGVGWLLSLSLINRLFSSSVLAVTAGELRNRIFELAHKAGVKVKQVYLLPKSSSQPANAFARSDNSVMITASLLKHLGKREVDAIMAHEIGHLREKHPQMRTYITIGAIVVTNLVGSSISTVANLPRSLPVVFSFSMLVSILILHFLSRGQERHADAIAIGLTADPESFISGMAKLCRLNLMPLNSGSWGESMESHPRTRNRLQEIAQVHGISEPRFQELLDAPLTTESNYSFLNADKVAGKAFSSDIKKTISTRRALIVLAMLVLLPVGVSLLIAQMQLSVLARCTAYASGVVVTLALCFILKNFLASRGFGRSAQALRNKLEQEGFADAARRGVLVGLAPAAQTQKYENYLFWDAGVLWLTANKLNYIGEETRFSLERERISKVYWRYSRAEWLADRSLFIEWRDEQDINITNTIYFVRIGGGSILQERRELLSLYARLNKWLEQSDGFPESSTELESLPSPAFSAITSEPASETFNTSLFCKTTLFSICVSAALSFAFRLSFAGACYSVILLFLVALLDEMPKILKRNPIEKAGASGPVSGYSQEVWAESNPATTSLSLE